jgi:hypothetical protein
MALYSPKTVAAMLIRVLSAGLVRRRQDVSPPQPALNTDEAYRLGQFALQFLH